MTGYSGTPLVKKLGIGAGHAVCYVNPPEGFGELLGELPDGVRTVSDLAGPLDVIVCFVRDRRVLEHRLKALRRAMALDGALWIAWPKKASKVETNMTEDVVRDVALPTGLVDNKVCAIDETWSGLRLVIRKELR
jgi:predicted CoA-binding protein